jgi:ribosomal-protein-alanine N-acetyltransferase
MEISVRNGRPSDLATLVAIQSASAELSAWTPESLGRVLAGSPDFGLLVADWDEAPAAFLLWRTLPEEETEIMSLAVDPAFRRRGLGQALLAKLFESYPGDCFLEVRVSNLPAQRLYGKMGFVACGLRSAYYHRPVEDALVMRRTEILPKDGTASR